jgi:phosphopantothenoylcysteine decarboxylase/phosphopantothenate--cysteine ligase
MERTTDILAELAAMRGEQVLIGFAVEHGADGLVRARDKRVRKAVDIVVHNDASREGAGFEGDDNIITVIGPGDDEMALPRMSKRACADHILDVARPLVHARPVTA